MSVHFFEYVKTLYPGLDEAEGSKAAGSILFDVAHALGRADAKAFHEAMKVSDPIAKLSSGPVHFAHTGWAFVDIFEESRPSPDENYYLVYDHPQSFEADSWLASDKRPGLPVCFMNAGYSSGWCEVSFSVDLVAKEMLCRAKGDPFCRFIMAHPGRVDGFVQEYRRSHPDLFAKA
jgi:predicted hydrocarbon binding protein